MSEAWQVSTPVYTCLVIVNDAGRIVYTAKYLEKTWLRRPWRSLHAALQQRWALEYRRTRLGEG